MKVSSSSRSPLVNLYTKSLGTTLFITPNKSKKGTMPKPFAQRMKKKKVNINGVQVLTHLGPTFGATIESRMY